jgi:hypothetical protein
MPFRYHARRSLLASALGLTVAAALAACSSGASSSSSAAAASTAASSAPVTSSAPVGSPSAVASSAAASGGGSSAAVTAIKANWVKFFSSSTPNSERVALLQNGQSFASAIKSFASSPLASQVSAKVDSVSLTSATLAAVKYDLTAAGTSVASGQSGSAVLQDGTWKVGDDVFCGLLKQGASLLGIAVPAACK